MLRISTYLIFLLLLTLNVVFPLKSFYPRRYFGGNSMTSAMDRCRCKSSGSEFAHFGESNLNRNNNPKSLLIIHKNAMKLFAAFYFFVIEVLRSLKFQFPKLQPKMIIESITNNRAQPQISSTPPQRTQPKGSFMSLREESDKKYAVRKLQEISDLLSKKRMKYYSSMTKLYASNVNLNANESNSISSAISVTVPDALLNVQSSEILTTTVPNPLPTIQSSIVTATAPEPLPTVQSSIDPIAVPKSSLNVKSDVVAEASTITLPEISETEKSPIQESNPSQKKSYFPGKGKISSVPKSDVTITNSSPLPSPSPTVEKETLKSDQIQSSIKQPEVPPKILEPPSSPTPSKEPEVTAQILPPVESFSPSPSTDISSSFGPFVFISDSDIPSEYSELLLGSWKLKEKKEAYAKDVISTEIIVALPKSFVQKSGDNNKWRVVSSEKPSSDTGIASVASVFGASSLIELEIDNLSGGHYLFKGFPIGNRVIGNIYSISGVKSGVFQLEKN